MIHDPELKRARALLMVSRRVMGFSYSQIAAEFNVTMKTVARSLNYAKRAGLVTSFEDQILQELVPEAIAQMKKAMQNGDTAAALEVLKGTGLMLKPSEKAKSPLGGELGEGESLEVYIRKIRGDGRTAEEEDGEFDPTAAQVTDHGSVVPAPAVLDAAPSAEGVFEVRHLDDEPSAANEAGAPAGAPAPAGDRPI